MLIIDEAALAHRRDAVNRGGPLAPLFDSLASELTPWLASSPTIPAEKALLSRIGGRCESCRSTLEFDPASPRRHHCPSCGRGHIGAFHDRAWLMPYQLWLAERAVQGALFHLLRRDPAHASFARAIVRGYAERYLSYPNTDNVLGPTRLFFSTYLESIWLLQICLAAAFLEASGDDATATVARERIIAPSRALVASYDEGMSNRQVWNNAALIASSLLLGADRDVDALAHGPSGVEAHLAQALLPDGTWYEGENYHQFALRGLWYGVTMLEVAGVALRRDLRDRFQRAFAAPFVTALPDFTMPSRKDSQYAVSLRQWRIAELTELGFARRQDSLLGDALLQMYSDDAPRRDTGRSRSTADVERNAPASRLTREDLGWRALLHALPTLPRLTRIEPRSAILESQGYAVFRREGGIYAGFEFGQSGGGHGHPDRLNLTLYQGATRWLDDMGTGSYVDPSLHWYRSTLAHNAPLVNGRSQPVRDGMLLAYDEREGLGWIVAEFRIPELDARLERAVVVAPDYLIVELSWSASETIRVDVPWHLPAGSVVEAGDPVTVDVAESPENDWRQLREWRRSTRRGTFAVEEGRTLQYALLSAPDQVHCLEAMAPGQPFDRLHPMRLHRVHAAAGRMLHVFTWAPRLTCSWGTDEPLTVEVADGERHLHRRDERGWHVQLEVAGATSSIDLSGFRPPATTDARPSPPPRVPMRLRGNAPLVYELGEAHYRRSEPTWSEAGAPAATVAIVAQEKRVLISIDVRAGDAWFAAADGDNPYDNEHPDTMRAGVQLYVRTGELHAWTLVPEAGTQTVRTRLLSGDAALLVESRWRPTQQGYEMTIALAGIAGDFSMDVIINETVRGRERRRGQLVMSGARGEFVYLRGDRHDVTRLIPMTFVP